MAKPKRELPAQRALQPLPTSVGFSVMEARLVSEIPEGDHWQYEPKWDGFRCLALKDSEQVELLGKSGKSLSRFFPEVVAGLQKATAARFVLDGELVIRIGRELSFSALQNRLHPALSRIQKLSTATPSKLVVFDCLLDAKGRSMVSEPFSARRRALERLFDAKQLSAMVELTNATTDRRVAVRWLREGQGGTDGVVAKRLDLDYRPGERATLKIKRRRTADCVVGGFRYEEGTELVGSLLLGLYDSGGLLHHVGFTSSLARSVKPALTTRLKALIEPPGFTGDSPGGPSRWSTDRSRDWQPLRPELVVEVSFDHVTDRRFRHGTKLERWRPDKVPPQCTFEQIDP
jgi:ATP-dependent DNA ligase